jgi:hypothetical protein
MHEVCPSLLVALEPTPGESRSEARSSMNRCAQSFHFNHCKTQVHQSANKPFTICKRDIHTNLKSVTVGKCLASRGKDSPTPCPNPIHTPVTDRNLSRAWKVPGKRQLASAQKTSWDGSDGTLGGKV